MPILHIHGTEDPCWGYDGHITEPLCGSDSEGLFVSVDQSMTFWRDQNGCTGTREEAITNINTDGTLSTRIFGNACRTDTEHIRIEGGGHAWPDGEPYLDASRIGRVPTDFNGNELIWAFLSAHTR
jgi:polyhydroxybutyrate depolymerase